MLKTARNIKHFKSFRFSHKKVSQCKKIKINKKIVKKIEYKYEKLKY